MSLLRPSSEPFLVGLLTIPDVTVLLRVKGLPKAITNSPVRSLSESPSLAGFKSFYKGKII